MAPNPHSQLWRWEVAAMLGAQASDLPPPHPSENQLWFESDTGSLFIWYVDPDSAQWVQIAGPKSLFDPFLFGTADMAFYSVANGIMALNSKADRSGADIVGFAANGNIATVGTVSTPGVIFPAAAVDSANPNALDDYEEGTWTPTLVAATGTITSYTASGTYVKIGKMVWIEMDATITNNGTGAGSIAVSGLPFTPTGNSSGGGREVAVSGHWVGASISNGSTSMSLLKYDNTYPGATNWQLRISANYRA